MCLDSYPFVGIQIMILPLNICKEIQAITRATAAMTAHGDTLSLETLRGAAMEIHDSMHTLARVNGQARPGLVHGQSNDSGRVFLGGRVAPHVS